MSNLTLEPDTKTELSAIEELELQLQRQMRGRIRFLRVAPQNDGLVLSGSAGTYYEKQLAQQALLQSTDLPLVANEISVR